MPDTFGGKHLGSLAGWPDSRLADALYTCGLPGLGTDEAVTTASGNLGELVTTFPRSPQAGKVEPAISSRIDQAAKGLKGDEPCAATERLRTLSSQATALPGRKDAVGRALRRDSEAAEKKVQAGTYACGVDEYEDGDFDAALDTMNGFTDQYEHDENRARAQKIAIAAEIAQDEPAAGKHLPTTASGGSIPVTISNDSPDEVEILYTGRSTTGAGTNTAEIRSGYTYTECAYVVRSTGSGYAS
ncbi:hypothetical protein AB0M87_25900 [Streptomyces sp. NPDC051320]|uniref:hypothetical protein n=1 Tax=Streptomyces sp. NPDC051320 TaxID=3154644 RepID=UPI00342576B9